MERRALLTGAVAARPPLPPRVSPRGWTASRRGAGPVSSPRYQPASTRTAVVENAVVPFFLTSIYEGERPALPMIDVDAHQGERPAPRSLGADLPGLEAHARGRRHGVPAGAGEAWRQQPSQADLHVRGHARPVPANVQRQGRRVLRQAARPAIRRQAVHAALSRLLLRYLLGSASRREGRCNPAEVRTIGESFNTVLAFRDPTQPIVYENYMTVRALLDSLKSWIDERLGRHRQRAHRQSGEDDRLVLAQECRRRRAFQQEGRRLRVLPQLRGAQPVGQHDLRHHVAPEPGWRRSRRPRVRSRRR